MAMDRTIKVITVMQAIMTLTVIINNKKDRTTSEVKMNKTGTIPMLMVIIISHKLKAKIKIANNSLNKTTLAWHSKIQRPVPSLICSHKEIVKQCKEI